MLSVEEGAHLINKLKTGMTTNGANLTPKDCAAVMALQQEAASISANVEQFKQVSTMAIARLGGYMEVTEEEIAEFKGGLAFSQNVERTSRIIGFMPSEEDRYVGLEDVLVEGDDDDSLEWTVIAKSPTGAVVAHCDDSFRVLSQEDIDSNYLVSTNPNRVTIEEVVRQQKEEQSGPKILRP